MSCSKARGEMLKFAIKREQSQACLNYAEPMNETRAEDACILWPCKGEEDKVNVSKLNEVKQVQHDI